MKASLLLASLAVSLAAAVSAQAQTPAPTAAPTAPAAPAPKDFSTRKADMLAQMDQRIASMTQARACVAAASGKADLKACHPQWHRGQHAMKDKAPA